MPSRPHAKEAMLLRILHSLSSNAQHQPVTSIAAVPRMYLRPTHWPQ